MVVSSESGRDEKPKEGGSVILSRPPMYVSGALIPPLSVRGAGCVLCNTPWYWQTTADMALLLLGFVSVTAVVTQAFGSSLLG